MSLEKAAPKSGNGQPLSSAELAQETGRLMSEYRSTLEKFPQWQQLFQNSGLPKTISDSKERYEVKFLCGALKYTACCFDSPVQQWIEVSREPADAKYIEQVDLRLGRNSAGKINFQRLAFRKSWKEGSNAQNPFLVANRRFAIRKVEMFLNDFKRSLPK